MEASGEILGRGQVGKGSREGRKEPHRGRQGGSSGSPRDVLPSREMGGTAASQKTGTGGRKQVGKEGAGRILGWVGGGGRRSETP